MTFFTSFALSSKINFKEDKKNILEKEENFQFQTSMKLSRYDGVLKIINLEEKFFFSFARQLRFAFEIEPS